MSGKARDALRRYLEQRRELGERELVLDTLSVDDVLGMLGARRGGAADDDLAAPADHPQLHETAPAIEPPRAEEPAEGPPGSADWREALRAAGADEPGQRAAPRVEPVATPPTPERELDPVVEPPPPVASPVAGGDFGAPNGLVVGAVAGALFGGPLENVTSLEEIAQIVAGCTACPLYKGAKNPVPGEGSPTADLVVVGEAPGADEDASGRPFVGASGQLLTKILAAINLRREEVFICNVVKHRPPGNRNPEPDEVAACSPYLVRQLELLRPKVILTLGNFAAQTLLGTKLGITRLRGQVHRYHGIPLVATYHPAALLRNPTWKRPTWEDVQLARRILDRAG